ncbi:MAG: hypothetical protein M3P49_14630 [Actinomycetota bacterium]|nr:hypothetical protein [Actinomycetota bacterium]
MNEEKTLEIWELWRHRKDPRIAYWACFGPDAVHIRSPKNVATDEPFRPWHRSTSSGTMPKKAFMELYEKDTA